MAERRMFAKTIIDSDAFLDMPITSQLLYFHLSMRADDDGFVNKPKSIMRMIGCKDDDLMLLFGKKFLIPFESGVVVIKHWKIHNYIRKDTYTETKYKEEKATLEMDENNAYRLSSCDPLQLCDDTVTDTSTQDRLGKDRLGKVSTDILPGAETAPDPPKPPTRQNQRKTSSPIVITITLNDKTEYEITEADVAAWHELYPAVDIMQELRKMKGWADANPSRRKTRGGIKRFINAWLAKEQDNYHGPQGGTQNGAASQYSGTKYGTCI